MKQAKRVAQDELKKPDRRVHRSRRTLHEALLALTVERGYDAVTVQQVLDRAEVARSTFYAHFRDKEDLLLAGFQEMRGALPGNLFAVVGAGHSGYPDFGLALFRHIDAQRALAKAFLGSTAGNIVYNHLRNILVVETREWLSTCKIKVAKGIPPELVVQHVAGSLFALLTWWVDHDFPHTPEKMGTISQQLIIAGLEGMAAPAK
ncbi:MAG: TetR/AcrR family transcriptional regulator [Betaproteobacteria bacterium]